MKNRSQHYEVIVANVGTVLDTLNLPDAIACFDSRAANGFAVYIVHGDRIIQSHEPIDNPQGDLL